MKANIDENGLLTIDAEMPIEHYALKSWIANYFGGDESSVLAIGKTPLQIIDGIPRPSSPPTDKPQG